MDTTLPMLAGTVSTIVFVASVLPMLHKALRTRELSSYSFGNIALANLGNAVHSVYVFNLPPGPIWVLHTFYVASSALMLYWYVGSRWLGARARAATRRQDRSPAQARSGRTSRRPTDPAGSRPAVSMTTQPARARATAGPKDPLRPGLEAGTCAGARA